MLSVKWSSWRFVAGGMFAVCLVFSGKCSAQPPQEDLETRSRELVLTSKQIQSSDDSARFTRDCLKFIDDAVTADKFPEAQKIATVAVESATKVGNTHLIAVCQAKKADVGFIVRESRSVAGPLKKLSASPDDPQANSIVGRYECLVKNDWTAGLEKVLKGNNAEWKQAAELDRKAGPEGADARAKLAAGDAWAGIGKTEKPPFNNRVDLRAHSWYRPVLLQATGDEQTAVRRYMQALSVCYVTDLQETEVRLGPWRLGKYGLRGDEGKILANDFPYPNGIGLHPHTEGEALIRFPIGGEYRTLRTGVAINDNVVAIGGPIYFAVYGDGKLLWKSPAVPKYRTALFTEVNVKGVKFLELRTSAPGSAMHCHAVWLDPLLVK